MNQCSINRIWRTWNNIRFIGLTLPILEQEFFYHKKDSHFRPLKMTGNVVSATNGLPLSLNRAFLKTKSNSIILFGFFELEILSILIMGWQLVDDH
jgi:hypothetical protein